MVLDGGEAGCFTQCGSTGVALRRSFLQGDDRRGHSDGGRQGSATHFLGERCHAALVP